MPVPDLAHDLNREKQLTDPASTLHFVRDLIALRRGHPALSTGSQEIAVKDGVIHVERQHGEQRVIVAINMSSEAQVVDTTGSTLVTRRAVTTSGQTCLDPNGIVVAVD